MSNIDYVLRDKLDTLNTTLKEILCLLRDSVSKEIVVNNIVTSQNERELTTEENNQIAVNISNRRNKNTKSVPRDVYKESVCNNKKILVGTVLPFSSILEFNHPTNVYIKSPNSYYPEFYIKEVRDSGSVYNLFKPSNDIIEIVDKSKGFYCVTGFLVEDGRAVYYDQYL